ncbi:Flagellar motor switch protein FliM [Chlamydiales bacterium SCGC AB-751-O23]|nr:Flagellar motor switch protein FliM [Chlamydiales bacterium SCGC AB-751-O23]
MAPPEDEEEKVEETPPEEVVDEETTEEAPSEDKEEDSEEEPEIMEYNFIRSGRIPEEQRNTVSLIYSSYAQAVSLSLSAFLRASVNVNLIKVEQQTFSEYINSLATPTCICSFDMQPLSGIGLIETNPSISFPVIDRLLGGEGAAKEEARNFTEVETAIAKKFVDQLLTTLDSAWKYILNIHFSAQEVQTNPAFIRSVPQQEVCITITLNMTVNEDATGIITICIPYVNLDPIAAKLGTQQWGQYSIKQTEAIQQAHHRNFSKIELNLSAILGSTDLTLLEVLALEPGDIISLNQKAKNPIDIRIEGANKFKATPGIWGKFKGISITSEVKGE